MLSRRKKQCRDIQSYDEGLMLIRCEECIATPYFPSHTPVFAPGSLIYAVKNMSRSNASDASKTTMCRFKKIRKHKSLSPRPVAHLRCSSAGPLLMLHRLRSHVMRMSMTRACVAHLPQVLRLGWRFHVSVGVGGLSVIRVLHGWRR